MIDFQTPDQVAERLGITKQTLSRMRTRGDGPRYSRIGNRVVYRPASVDEWLASLPEFRSTSEENV